MDQQFTNNKSSEKSIEMNNVNKDRFVQRIDSVLKEKNIIGGNKNNILPSDEPVKETEEKKQSFNCSCFKSLRTSTTFTLIILFSCMILGFAAIVGVILPVSFGKLEREDVSNAARRMMKSLYDDLNNNLRNLIPFSIWDESFYLVANLSVGNTTQEKIDAYMDSNFPVTIMTSSDVNFIVYYFTNGSLAIPRSFNSNTKTISKARESIPSVFQTIPIDHPLFIHNLTERKGGWLVDENDNLLMASTAPLIVSDWTDNSPISGFLLFARYYTNNSVNSVANSAQLCTSLHLLSDTNDLVSKDFSSDVKDISGTIVSIIDADWLNNNVFHYGILSNDASIKQRQCWKANGAIIDSPRIYALQLVNDIFNQPLMIVRIDISRTVYYLGLQSLLIAIFLLLGVCVFASVVIIGFIEINVLGRILRLTSRIQEITNANETSLRINIKSKLFSPEDELDRMQVDINEMLTKIDLLFERDAEKRTYLQELLRRISIVEERTSSIMNSIKDVVLTVLPNGKIVHANAAFFENFSYLPVDIQGSQGVELVRVFPELEEKITGDDTLEQVLLSLMTGSSHHMKASTKFRKLLDFDIYIVKTKIVHDEEDCVAYVVVARSSSPILFSTLKKSDSLLDPTNEFDRLLMDKEEREKFKQFLRIEQSEENLLFIEDVLEYRSMKSHERIQKQDEIISTYLKGEESKHPLNISGNSDSTLIMINKGVGQLDLFDSLFLSIKNGLAMDKYRRYKLQNKELEYL